MQANEVKCVLADPASSWISGREATPGVHTAPIVVAQKFSVSVQPGPLLGRIEHEPQPDRVVLPAMEHVPHSSRWVLSAREHDPLIPSPWTAQFSETGLYV